MQQEVFEVLKHSLWGIQTEKKNITENVFSELKYHALFCIPAMNLSDYDMPDNLRNVWKKHIYQQIAYQTHYRYVQNNLPISVPYVILKGQAAAQYYPHPELRIMGDIDIMTRHEDYDLACECLLQNGYNEIHNEETESFGRHRQFVKNGIVIEVHMFFAMLNEMEKAEYLDNLIIQNINPTHLLPDYVNGLVILEHICQHLEKGIGLRQIIDWMMFVDKCLSDNNWPQFNLMVNKCGLGKIAIVVTHMCEMYLGLSQHTWCINADENICKRLMNYIMSCGNMGVKHITEDRPGISLLTYARGPIKALRLLQERGLANWKVAQKKVLLKPLAWIYQSGRYVRKSLNRERPLKVLKEEFDNARERKALLDELEVKQTSKGLVVYKNGKYMKTYRRP